MLRTTLAVLLVLLTITIVPILVYALFTVITDLRPPEGVSPAQFLSSVFVSKIGTAIAFVLIFYLARSAMGGRWLIYAFVWWLMFVFGEVGQAIGPDYSWKEAIAGILSETIYVPISGYIVFRFIGIK
jgi:hypothetical protein